ncbi:MAG: antibiotic biosynthesis monooxygenase family protein [Streptosporangiaceae bacterium]
MSVIFINLFEVPAGRDETFRDMWQQVNDYMRTQPGYQGHRLHRSLAEDARYRYTNVVSWESPEAWRAAHGEGFRKLVSQPGWREFPSTPALYEVVHAGEHAAPAFS